MKRLARTIQLALLCALAPLCLSACFSICMHDPSDDPPVVNDLSDEFLKPGEPCRYELRENAVLLIGKDAKKGLPLLVPSTEANETIDGVDRWKGYEKRLIEKGSVFRIVKLKRGTYYSPPGTNAGFGFEERVFSIAHVVFDEMPGCECGLAGGFLIDGTYGLDTINPALAKRLP